MMMHKDLCIVGEGYILGFKISRTYITYNNLNTTLIIVLVILFKESCLGKGGGGGLFLAILDYWSIIYRYIAHFYLKLLFLLLLN